MHEHAQANLSGKRLVIFGCGYVGGEVARLALARGVHVTALTRNAARAAQLRAMGIETVIADLAGDWSAQITGGADFVLDSVSSGGGGVAGYRRSYLEGLRAILTWAKKNPIGTLVYTSSTSVYADGNGARVTEETPIAARSETAAVLIETETLLRESGSGASARWFILRLAGIYGPGRHALLDQLRQRQNVVAGKSGHHLNLLHLDDAAAAIMAAFAAPLSVRNETFNVADGQPATKATVAGWLANQLHVPAPIFDDTTVPSRRGQVPDRIIDNSKLVSRLGWRPQFPDFRAGYEKILSR